MAELNTYIVTFNCGRTLVDVSYFASQLFNGLSKQHLPPDLIVLALQEIAPIANSFLGGSFLTPYFDRFSFALDTALKSQDWNSQYERVLASNVGLTGFMLYAKREVPRKIRWIETAGVGVGLWEMGNKGAVGIRLGYTAGEGGEEMETTFISAHLAPMEDACDRRNQDWKAINENLVFTRAPRAFNAKAKPKVVNEHPSEESEPLLSSATDDGTHAKQSTYQGPLTSTSHFFFSGDLNYRTSDKPPGPQDHRNWPQPATSPSEPHHFSNLIPKDQLTRERSAGRTLHYLTEAPINFPPTYKYSAKAQHDLSRRLARARATGNASIVPPPEENEWVWAKHRYPSWCDRILYLEPPFPGTQPKVLNYTSLPLQPTSDHKPVALHVLIPLKPLGGEAWIKPPFRTRADWAARRASARRKEVVVGVLAYLVLSWEGRAVLLGTLLGVAGGWAILRSLLSF
ncbi:hypothetical protein H2203_004492 [Taxawa tesnikishii (nom. ined.)]|nr:hypothetical protein H2203_004492 [Dothideales sp. JES 119]